MKQRFDQVLVLCPDAVTGGPEALHQLANSINSQGGNAKVVYTGHQSRFLVRDRTIECQLYPRSDAMLAYGRYDPQVLDSVEITADTLLVVPEIYVDLAWALRCILPARVACWWLAMHDLSMTHDSDACQRFMRDVIQVYQSQHALHQLLRLDAHVTVPMFDYTDRNFVRLGQIHAESASTPVKTPRSVAYFPRKGGEMAKVFFECCRDMHIVPVAIESMNKMQVMETLSTTEVYIDFGNHLGKDRVPREAAAVGNIVLLHRWGAAQGYLDHSIDETYKFGYDDIRSGALSILLEEIFRNPDKHRRAQSYYRQKIYLEQEEFDLQVKQFIFCSPY